MTQLRLTPATPPATRLEYIGLDEIAGEHVGPEPDDDLCASVFEFGVLQPVLVKKKGSKYEPVDGRRRIEALRRARTAAKEAQGEEGGKEADVVILRYEKIPAIIVDGLTPAITSVATVALHSTRSENVATTLNAIEDLVGRSVSEAEICAAMRLKPGQVRAVLKLQKLIEPLREALDTAQLRPSIAAGAARLPKEAQKKLAKKLAEGSHITAKDVREARAVQARKAIDTIPAAIFSDPEPPPAKTVITFTKVKDAMPEPSQPVLVRHGAGKSAIHGVAWRNDHGDGWDANYDLSIIKAPITAWMLIPAGD